MIGNYSNGLMFMGGGNWTKGSSSLCFKMVMRLEIFTKFAISFMIWTRMVNILDLDSSSVN